MLLMILLIGHMIADFYLQSSNMAENKQKSTRVLMVHSGIYLLVFAIIDFVFMHPQIAIWTTLIIASAHLFIDLIRIKIDNNFKNYKVSFLTFIIDQILHLATIIVTYYSLNLSININSVCSNCKSYPNFNKIVMYGLLFVFLLEPVAVLVKKTFAFLFKEETNNNLGNNAGSTIGKLERVITAILLLCNQYSVIGLVLTAKSIARFKQLEERDFAEKYLVGTLLSLSISLISTIIIKNIL